VRLELKDRGFCRSVIEWGFKTESLKCFTDLGSDRESDWNIMKHLGTRKEFAHSMICLGLPLPVDE
jgi:hypothetical protein